MARPAIFALIAVIGLPLGYYGRAALQQPSDRAAAMVSLFETYCLPAISGQPLPALDALVRLSGDEGWADQDSKLLLRRGESGCEISDTLRHFSAHEQAAVDAAIPALVTARFPELLPRNQNPFDWERFDMWAQFPANPAAGTAILLARYHKAGEGADTKLSLHLPPH